ncbi:MAG TPA: WYL domain-containing protein [Bacteroidales bacterium]|nr:WYL domain-containing protein [Bacteroidales bacterium]
MSKQESLTRYSLIIQKLRKKPSTYDEISNYLSLQSELQSYDFNISKRTFQRDLDDIRLLYNIDIRYDFSQKAYFICQETEPEINERILEAFDTFNLMNMSDRLSAFMHFERRRPQGTEHLYGLLHAIKNSFQIYFLYQKFWDEVAEKRYVEPLALKEFKNRWYLVSHDLKDGKIKTFGLDRMKDLDITKRKCQHNRDFSVEDYFRYCFGVISPGDETIQDIVLSFDPFQGKYIKTLPLHHTQEVLVDDENELRIKLSLYPTYDLMMEILSFGANVEVIRPKVLRTHIIRMLRENLNQYKN